MRIDIEKHRDLENAGLLSIRQHPELPLLIHNYTQRWPTSASHLKPCRQRVNPLDGVSESSKLTVDRALGHKTSGPTDTTCL